MYKILAGTVITLVISLFVSAKIPPGMKVCPRRSSDLAACFVSSMDLLRTSLRTGNLGSGFKIEGMDPLLIGNISINRGVDIKLFELQASGMSNFKIVKSRISLDPVKFELFWAIPKLTTKSRYSLNWQVGTLKLQGKGECQTLIDKVKVVSKIRGSKYLRDGEEFLKADTVKVIVKYDKIQTNFDNLFNGQKDLEKVANELINQNFNLFERDMFGQIEKNLETRILKIVNEFFEQASFAELFP